MRVTANGKTFTFPDGTPPDAIGEAIDEYFSQVAPKTNLTSGDIPVVGSISPNQAEKMVPVQQPAQQQPQSVMGNLKGAAEYGKDVLQTGAAMASGIGSDLLGRVTALAGGGYPANPEKQSQIYENVTAANQYVPTRPGAQAMLGGLSKALQPLEALPPVLGVAAPQIAATAAAKSMAPKIPEPTPKSMQQALDINRGVSDKSLALKTTSPENPMKVISDPVAKNAVNDGFSEKFVGYVKQLSADDKKKVSQMIDTVERGENEFYASKYSRPSDVVGDSLSDRVRYVKQTNKVAGSEIDRAAEKLKGQSVDVSAPVSNFIDELGKMGVTLDKNNVPKFKGSDIEGFGADEKIIAQVIGRMRNTKAPDAYDVHRLKRYIDRNVTYGKASEGGVDPATTRVLKSLRTNLDNMLDESFPEYNSANVKYKDTIQALDDMQTAAGKVDLLSDGSEKAIGSRARALLSNQQGRSNLENSIRQLDSVAKKYNGRFDDDILAQVAVVDELEKVFGTRASTSLGGELTKTAEDIATKGVLSTATDKAFGLFKRSDEQRRADAIKSLRKLMQRREK